MNVANDKVLHVYVEFETGTEFIPAQGLPCFNSTMATMEGPNNGIGISSSTSYSLKYEDEKILKILEKYAMWSGSALRIHDLANKEEKQKAKAVGIKTAPTILVNDHKIAHVPSDEDALLRILGVQDKERKEIISREPILTVTVEGNAACKNCGSTNLKIYSDGSGFCQQCNDVFQTPLQGKGKIL
jgi:hypothetical protein